MKKVLVLEDESSIRSFIVINLRRAGYDVTTEYYINDAGRQMRILGMSVWYRLRNLVGRTMAEPEDYYRGSYITDIAKEMLEKDPSLADASDEDGKERCYEYAKNEILEGIKKDLRDFRVEHQNWFSEKTLVDGGLVDKAFQALKDAGYTYEKDGALWFATSRLGDDKDRVLRKSDGSLTYFASDIAYHHNKFERGFDWLIDVWGADHHGHAIRFAATMRAPALGLEGRKLDFLIMQMVRLMRGDEIVKVSKRTGKALSLADLMDEIGVDACRFFFNAKPDSHLEFDLDLAIRQDSENPVYYVQYAHARICTLLAAMAEAGCAVPAAADVDAALLTTPQEHELIKQIAMLPEEIHLAARDYDPSRINRYVTELAARFHRFYNVCRIKDAEPAVRDARLKLADTTRRVLEIGLDIIGVTAPEKM